MMYVFCGHSIVHVNFKMHAPDLARDVQFMCKVGLCVYG